MKNCALGYRISFWFVASFLSRFSYFSPAYRLRAVVLVDFCFSFEVLRFIALRRLLSLSFGCLSGYLRLLIGLAGYLADWFDGSPGCSSYYGEPGGILRRYHSHSSIHCLSLTTLSAKRRIIFMALGPLSQIQCDANATYGITAEVAMAVGREMPGLGNPSSVHQFGQRAREIVESCRAEVLALVDAPRGSTLIWTSGATEANNLALYGLSGVAFRPVLVTSSNEHPSVLETVRALGSRPGYNARLVPPAGFSLNQEALVSACADAGVLSVMLANNESGVLNDVGSLVAALKKEHPSLLIHVDAVQALGKVPVSLRSLGVDAITISGHKIGGFPGLGAVILRPGLQIVPAIFGGHQESGFRAGTEAVPAILSLLVAITALQEQGGVEIRARRLADARTALMAGFIGAFGTQYVCHAEGVPRIPNTASLRIPGVVADDLVVAADIRGVAISAGAACASGRPEPSHVLREAGLSEEEARQTIRLSVNHAVETERYREAGTIIGAIARGMQSPTILEYPL